jgi:hypothetical protein
VTAYGIRASTPNIALDEYSVGGILREAPIDFAI